MTAKGEPKVGPCPPWCEEEPGHEWEDEWNDGLIRYHKVWRKVGDSMYYRIGIEEIEQALKGGGIKRERNLVLDVESPTNWSYAQAREGLDIMQALLKLCESDWPHDGDVR